MQFFAFSVLRDSASFRCSFYSCYWSLTNYNKQVAKCSSSWFFFQVPPTIPAFCCRHTNSSLDMLLRLNSWNSNISHLQHLNVNKMLVYEICKSLHSVFINILHNNPAGDRWQPINQVLHCYNERNPKSTLCQSYLLVWARIPASSKNRDIQGWIQEN